MKKFFVYILLLLVPVFGACPSDSIENAVAWSVAFGTTDLSSDVHIAASQKIILDSNVVVHKLVVSGTLIWDEARSVNLTARLLQVTPSSSLIIGSESCLYSQKTFISVGPLTNLDEVVDKLHFSLETSEQRLYFVKLNEDGTSSLNEISSSLHARDENGDKFQSTLAGCILTPPVTTTAVGLSTDFYVPQTGFLTLAITHQITFPVTAAIHVGAAGVVGPALLTFPSAISPINMVVPFGEAKHALLWQGQLYINITSTTFPTGELRGQLGATSTLVGTPLNAAVVPANDCPIPDASTGVVVLYGNGAVQAPWVDISTANRNLASAEQTLCTTTSAKVTMQAGVTFAFKTTPVMALDTTITQFFEFFARTGAGQSTVLDVKIATDANGAALPVVTANGTYVTNLVITDVWTRARIPLTSFGVALVQDVFSVTITQNAAITTTANVFFDQVRFVDGLVNFNAPTPITGTVSLFADPNCNGKVVTTVAAAATTAAANQNQAPAAAAPGPFGRFGEGFFIGSIVASVVFVTAAAIFGYILVKRSRAKKAYAYAQRNAALQKASPVPSSAPLAPAPSSGPGQMRRVGQVIQAQWSGDGKFYRARIEKIDNDQYYVNFIDFTNSAEWVDASTVM